MRKKTSEQELRKHCEDIRNEINQWEYINQNGCNDPQWPDGVNMNLTRNHIIYAKQQIAEICEQHGIPIPEEMYLPTPPEVDDCYMANMDQGERIKTLKRMGDKLTREKIKYDREQLSLFSVS